MFKGKAIYQPTGKAAEYAAWACNFYVGCSNNCSYCYCKKGILANAMGQDKPQLKKCFRDEDHAFDIFQTEVSNNVSELRKHGLFFSFTTDPLLPETRELTAEAIDFCTDYGIPVKMLTKRSDWLDYLLPWLPINLHHLYAFGFTLTGHDELEPGASTNQERIEAMRKLHNEGFRTFASVEPIIDFVSSQQMISKSIDCCDLYKIGLESGEKYNIPALQLFVGWTTNLSSKCGFKIYFKDSLLKAAGISRESLPANCVTRDYNMFEL